MEGKNLCHFFVGVIRLACFKDLGDCFLKSTFGVADIETGDARSTMGQQPVQTTWFAEDIEQFGIDKVFDGPTQRFGLRHF